MSLTAESARAAGIESGRRWAVLDRGALETMPQSVRAAFLAGYRIGVRDKS